MKGKIKEKDEEIESLRSIYEEYELMKNTLEDLSSSIIETEKINNGKNKQNSFIIDGIEIDTSQPKWKNHRKILYDFQSCLHDGNKILSLISRCGWKLENSSNHKKYIRETPRGNIQILICPCSPKTSNGWKRTWCELKKYEIELIKELL